MRLDHVVFAAGPEGLDAAAGHLGELLGVDLDAGGVHPRFGTINRILPLAGGHFLEVVAVLDHPAADKVAFGQAVKARQDSGGGWLGWCVSVDDIGPLERRLARASVMGNRTRPDGVELRWRQLGMHGLLNDPQLPFFIQWESDLAEHPSRSASGEVDLARMELAGDPQRVVEWLGEPEQHPLDDVEVDWIAPNGTPGIVACHFSTRHGVVRV